MSKLTAVTPTLVPFAPGTTTPNAGGGIIQPPTASATSSADPTTGYTVTLDGTGSSAATGHSLTAYAWTQTAGTTVTLSGATTSTATFTPAAAGSYTFKLTVTQDDSQTASTAVTVTVNDPRQITWAGKTWNVKPILASAGPGPNAWSDSTSNVYLDGNGKLHLAVVQDAQNVWRCAEIFGPHLGYGTYQWVVDTDLSAISQYFVIGMFVYDKTAPSPYREIDIEFSQFGNAANDRLWFTVQPPSTSTQKHVPLTGFTAPYTVKFDWTATNVTWTATDSLGATIGTYSATPAQPTGNELVQMNVWLNAGHAPPGPLDVQFSSFTFTPAGPPSGTLSGTVAWAGSTSGTTTHEGTTAGTVAWAGSVSGQTTHAGSVAGTVKWTGAVSGTAPAIGVPTGTVAGIVSWAGAVSGSTKHDGTISGTVTWAGSLTGRQPVTAPQGLGTVVIDRPPVNTVQGLGTVTVTKQRNTVVIGNGS